MIINMLRDKELKLITLALDKAATDAESSNAAQKFIRMLRKRNATIDDITGNTSLARYVVIDFGKYEGYPLGDIPTDYLLWLSKARNISRNLRDSINAVLNNDEKDVK